MAVKRAKNTRRTPSDSIKSKTAKAKAPKRVAPQAASKPASKPASKAAKVARPAPKAAKKSPRTNAAGAAVTTLRKAPADVVPVIEGALDEMKAVNVKVMNVRKLTDITDTMIIASGNSDRHVRSIADRVVEHAKKAGFRPMGVEGERDGEWVLVDLQDVIVHIMLPRVREFYRLENLWDVSAARREAQVEKSA